MSSKEHERSHRRSLHDASARSLRESASSHAAPAGAPLETAVRTRMEPSFQFDFSQVRVHADRSANDLTSAIGAVAFNVGSDIFFSDGSYSPGSEEGDKLLAHELAHVVQREASPRSSSLVSRASDAAELQATEAATAVSLGGEASALGGAGVAPATVAREGKEGKEEESIFGTIGELLKSPEDMGAADVLKEAGAPKGAFDALGPISNVFGMFGNAQKAVDSAKKGDMLGTVSGSTGLVGADMGLTGWMMKNFAGNEMLGNAFSGVGSLFGAASSGMDAYGDFRDGNYGKGALDSTKTLQGGMSGLATLGGFELSSVAGMDAGAALLGGGGEGLAALGPAGAVLGSGLAGYGVGTAGLGLANNYAKKHDIFGEGRDSTEAAADAGIAVSDYFHDSWAGGAGDVFGDVAGGVTSVGASIGTAAYSGLHAAGGAISDFFSGPSIMDVVKQQMEMQAGTQQVTKQLEDTMDARDREQMQRELYGY